MATAFSDQSFRKRLAVHQCLCGSLCVPIVWLSEVKGLSQDCIWLLAWTHYKTGNVRIILVADIPLCWEYISKTKLNIYSVWYKCTLLLLLLLLLLFYHWLLISTSTDHHQTNIYKQNLKILVHIVQKRQFYGIPYTFTSSLYNYIIIKIYY